MHYIDLLLTLTFDTVGWTCKNDVLQLFRSATMVILVTCNWLLLLVHFTSSLESTPCFLSVNLIPVWTFDSRLPVPVTLSSSVDFLFLEPVLPYSFTSSLKPNCLTNLSHCRPSSCLWTAFMDSPGLFLMSKSVFVFICFHIFFCPWFCLVD